MGKGKQIRGKAVCETTTGGFSLSNIAMPHLLSLAVLIVEFTSVL